jgi:cell division protein ZapB
MRERYQASLAREAALREERADLIKKNDLARAKVEAIISRLRELEQN